MHDADHELLSRNLDEHSAALVLFAQQWCATPEDVVQEAFIQLMQQRPLPNNVVGWLYRVVRNGAIGASRAPHGEFDMKPPRPANANLGSNRRSMTRWMLA